MPRKAAMYTNLARSVKEDLRCHWCVIRCVRSVLTCSFQRCKALLCRVQVTCKICKKRPKQHCTQTVDKAPMSTNLARSVKEDLRWHWIVIRCVGSVLTWSFQQCKALLCCMHVTHYNVKKWQEVHFSSWFQNGQCMDIIYTNVRTQQTLLFAKRWHLLVKYTIYVAYMQNFSLKCCFPTKQTSNRAKFLKVNTWVTFLWFWMQNLSSTPFPQPACKFSTHSDI